MRAGVFVSFLFSQGPAWVAQGVCVVPLFSWYNTNFAQLPQNKLLSPQEKGFDIAWYVASIRAVLWCLYACLARACVCVLAAQQPVA